MHAQSTCVIVAKLILHLAELRESRVLCPVSSRSSAELEAGEAIEFREDPNKSDICLIGGGGPTPMFADQPQPIL